MNGVSVDRLKPYPEMKDSGVEWLGEVPAHWEVRRGKQIFRCIDVRSDTGQEELLTVSSNHGVVPRQSVNVTMFKAESYIGYKLCWPNDLVINSLWAWARGLGISEHHGIISSAYGVYRPSQSVEPKFIHLLVRSIPFQWELRVLSKGIWISRLQLTDDSFLCASLPLPPLSEQTAIARFLDHMARRIRDCIRAKEKLIALLDEYKQALISEAVTGRTDVRTGAPYPDYKDSGVEWLGQVPTHWEVRRLKHWLEINQAVLSEMTDSDYEFDYIDIGSVEAGQLIAGTKRMRFADAPSRARRIVRANDTIVSTVRTYLKAVWYAKKPAHDLIASTGFAVLTPNCRTEPKFISYVAQSDVFTNRVTAESVGIAYPAIAETKLGTFEVCIPPLPEQTAIVEHLDKAAAAIDADTARARRQIDLLGEYRTRLIADAVTGKLDVRGAAAALPDPGVAPDEATAAP